MRLLQQGFSLLETLVAFSILALSLGVILQIFSHGTHYLSLGRTSNEAVILAQSLLASAPREMQAGGILQGRVRQMDWQVTAKRYQADAADTPYNETFELQRLRVDIHWRERGRPRDFSMITLRPRLRE